MIAAARRTVLLADHTKVGNDHLIRFAELDDVDTFITDQGLDDELSGEIVATGLRVVRA
jgi:DeoR family transcriptional regulator, fructose operon transcriptional repressor